jgi:hypothetical protein
MPGFIFEQILLAPREVDYSASRGFDMLSGEYSKMPGFNFKVQSRT